MKEFIDKIIERLEEEILTCQSAHAESIIGMCGKSAEHYMSEKNAYEKIKKIVNQLSEEYNNGWIACSERLPEDGQWVVFTLDEEVVDNDDVMVGYYEASKNWCVNDAYFPNAFRFIAWMPLPAPYKEGE